MKENILKKIKEAAARDQKKRKNLRFLKTMAFLTRKGVLKANRNYDKWFEGALNIQDAIWAGKNVEPRILEVLPAIALRLPREIVLEAAPRVLIEAVEALKNKSSAGPEFMGVPFEKYKIWLDLVLKDGRTKPFREKKVMKSFRLSPKAIDLLEKRKKETGKSGADIIELLLET